MSKILIFIFCMVNLNIYSQSIESTPYNYEQDGLNYDDAEGDFFLGTLRKEYGSFKRLWKMLTGRLDELLIEDREKFEYLKNISDVEEKYFKKLAIQSKQCDELDYKCLNENLIIEGRQSPFDVDKITEAFSMVVSRYSKSHEVTAGVCHEWSPSMLEKHSKDLKVTKRMNKILAALSLGVTSSYMKTGTEFRLLDWMSLQADKSIELDSIFNASLSFNNGNVYLAILTIENVLSRFWRADSREDFLIIRKLKPISNIYNGKGDIFGTWYHFWGMKLYGYCYGSFKARLVGFVETLGSHFSYGFKPEPQQDWVNRKSGKIGGEFKKIILNKEYQNQEIISEKLSHDYYLTLNEDFRDRLYYKETKDIKIRIEGDEIALKSKVSLKQCNVTFFPFENNQFDSRLKSEKTNITFDANKSKFFPGNWSRYEKVKVLFSGCIIGE